MNEVVPIASARPMPLNLERCHVLELSGERCGSHELASPDDVLCWTHAQAVKIRQLTLTNGQRLGPLRGFAPARAAASG
jgi:hypothetical protein